MDEGPGEEAVPGVAAGLGGAALVNEVVAGDEADVGRELGDADGAGAGLEVAGEVVVGTVTGVGGEDEAIVQGEAGVGEVEGAKVYGGEGQGGEKEEESVPEAHVLIVTES